MTLLRGFYLGLWSLVLPVFLYFAMVVTFGLDMLDLSSTAGNMILVVTAGVLAGLIVGFGFSLRDWRILTPAVLAGVIGFGLHPLMENVAWTADNATLAYVLVWLGQSLALYLSVWLSSKKGATSPAEVDGARESRDVHLV